MVDAVRTPAPERMGPPSVLTGAPTHGRRELAEPQPRFTLARVTVRPMAHASPLVQRAEPPDSTNATGDAKVATTGISLSPGVDAELATRFSNMVAELQKRKIAYTSTQDLRPAGQAHVLSTAYHLREKGAISVPALRSLKGGKDLDGNVWYDPAWDQLVPTWGGYGTPRAATDEEVLERAKENAFDLAKGQGADYVSESSWSGSSVHCALEGYPPGDPKRKPNIDTVPMSNHVNGNAVDLSGVDWDQFGGRWSPQANEFVASFGLTRPYSPESATYCQSEHWHFELAPATPPREGSQPVTEPTTRHGTAPTP